MTSPRQEAAVAWWQTPALTSEDQRPFTDFGQFGHGQLDTRVFGQDIYWVDIAGNPHFLVDMSREYQANVIAFLRRGAAGWWSHEAIWLSLCAELLVTACPHDPATSQVLDRLAMLVEIDPEDWMEASPLMRRLRDLQSRGATHPAEGSHCDEDS